MKKKVHNISIAENAAQPKHKSQRSAEFLQCQPLCTMKGDKLNLTNLAYPQPHKKQPMPSRTNPRSASVIFLQPHAELVKQDAENPAHPIMDNTNTNF